MKTNILTLVLVLIVFIFAGIHFGSLPWTPARIAGVVIGLPSLALLVLARIQLGGSFSVRPKAQALVTHGLYSRIRNPIYLFGAALSLVRRRSHSVADLSSTPGRKGPRGKIR